MRRAPGWVTIAGKEFADLVLSARFYVLLVILGIAALIPIYFGADRIQSVAGQASGSPALFLALFQIGPSGVDFVRADVFVSMAAPLLGIAFAFDAVNGERHQGTLPRLLSQPIHRDDVINGKFAAGLAAIAMVLAAVLLVVSGFGIFRLGIVPAPEDVLRLVAWYVLTVLYVALWLAFGLLLSVVIGRAATSALVGFGVWLFVAIPFFGPLLLSLASQVLAPTSTLNAQYGVTNEAQQFIQRLLPSTLYSEASGAILNPGATLTSSPTTLDQLIQAQQQIQGSSMSFDQSLLLVWPHIVALLALTALCFALAYVSFMRQEVRA
ncbi:MAG TPA: ABC transporter permease subunit [Candidatus Limnocylindrales bacterium]|nr:ABC transporter permease subunit [Candidatus Limnocylindrales bacterium]